MKLFYSDHVALPLPPDHRFPIAKYALLHRRVLEEQLVPPENLCPSPAASDEEILRVHLPEYWQKVAGGTLSEREIRRIGFPWSPELVERSRRSVGGTIAACQSALSDGFAANLAGGTHHAYPDHGEGYCVLNDVAIAARAVQAAGLAARVAIIDCDVHQGNGTAAIFAGDSSVFTFSIHGARNFPFHKEAGDLDIALLDGCDDAGFVDALQHGLDILRSSFRPDLAIYIAGADPYHDDRLGKLSMTKAGLLERDRIVFERCLDDGVPLAIVMGGGYARRIEDTVDIQFNTLRLAVEMAGNQ